MSCEAVKIYSQFFKTFLQKYGRRLCINNNLFSFFFFCKLCVTCGHQNLFLICNFKNFFKKICRLCFMCGCLNLAISNLKKKKLFYAEVWQEAHTLA